MGKLRMVLATWAQGVMLGLAVTAVALGQFASPARGATSAAQQQADKYSPIVMLRAQTDGICDSSEEQYWPPTSVDTVLNNPRVKLLSRFGGTTQVIKRAPTARDLARLPEGVYLDLPGSPLSPGCKYARDFARMRRAGTAPAVTYAHIARESGHAGFALQYWFYYYFNDFTDLHESDWEGMQLTFPASTPAQALAQQPDQIVLFQHSGGEHTDWDDRKVEKEGTHPVVYSAAGSHATFYSPALWLGNGQSGSGVGCDNTEKPLISSRPQAVLVPDTPSTKGQFAWLRFTGRWGQREAGFNNGPGGANTKTVWRQPFTWMDGTRSVSPEVPGGSLMGPSVAGAFCGAVEAVTGFLNLSDKSTPAAIAIVAGFLLLIIVPIVVTRWTPVVILPLRQPRAFGQLLLTSARMYGRYWLRLMMLAASILAVLGAIEGLEWLVRRVLHAYGSTFSFSDAGIAITVSAPASIGRTLATPIVSAVVIAFIRNLERGQSIGFKSTWGAVLRRLWRLLVVDLIALVLVGLLFLTVIGIPYAIKKYVDWQFAQQEILFEDKSIRESLHGSTQVVRGHWFHTAGVAAALFALSQIPGPVVGFALLFTTLPVGNVNLIGSVIFALLLPMIEIGRTLLYLDLMARKDIEVVPATVAVAPAPAV